MGGSGSQAPPHRRGPVNRTGGASPAGGVFCHRVADRKLTRGAERGATKRTGWSHGARPGYRKYGQRRPPERRGGTPCTRPL